MEALLATSLPTKSGISAATVSTETPVGRSRFHERDRRFAVYRWPGETIGWLGNSSADGSNINQPDSMIAQGLTNQASSSDGGLDLTSDTPYSYTRRGNVDLEPRGGLVALEPEDFIFKQPNSHAAGRECHESRGLSTDRSACRRRWTPGQVSPLASAGQARLSGPAWLVSRA
ncbi:hypothetical protein K0M31_000402 [Melipona bicolor]|uniref:Uncharacterized protein n=1 Tax=Melipona bicolor TaxID=60889 RepID=A0AA40KWT3_9HYME|nr:hypothetical protein K0M31_000402 [Melipona bicolor]